MSYQPPGFLEKVGDALGAAGRVTDGSGKASGGQPALAGGTGLQNG